MSGVVACGCAFGCSCFVGVVAVFNGVGGVTAGLWCGCCGFLNCAGGVVVGVVPANGSVAVDVDGDVVGDVEGDAGGDVKGDDVIAACDGTVGCLWCIGAAGFCGTIGTFGLWTG